MPKRTFTPPEIAPDGASVGTRVGGSAGSAGGGATGTSVEVAVGSTAVRVGLGVDVLLRVGGSTPEDGVDVGVRVPPGLSVF